MATEAYDWNGNPAVEEALKILITELGLSYKWTTQRLNKTYNLKLNPNQVRCKCRNEGWHSIAKVPTAPEKTPEELVAEEKEKAEKRAEQRRFIEAIKEKAAVDSVIETLKDTIITAKPIPEPKIIPPKTRFEPETVVLNWSDSHIGEAIEPEELGGLGGYNSKIYLKYLENLKGAINNITEIHRRAYPLKEFVVNFIGDIITNELIYEGQQAYLDQNLIDQFMLATTSIRDFLRWLLTLYPSVECNCVYGNHGRVSKQTKAFVNWDYLLYKFLEIIFKNEKRIKFNIPKAWWYLADIRGHKFLLMHGEDIRSYMSLPHYSLERFEGRWLRLLRDIGETFTYYLVAHHHQFAAIQGGGGGERFINGCLRGDTPILMANTSLKMLKDIRENDLVMGFKKNPKGVLLPTRVLGCSKRQGQVFKLSFTDGRNLFITKEHPVLNYTRTAWQQARFLKDTKGIYHPRRMVFDKEWVLGYLAGFLDGDGHIRRNVLNFYNTELELLEQIQMMLHGIKPDISLKIYEEKRKRPTKRQQFILRMYGIKDIQVILEKIFKKQNHGVGNRNYDRGYLAGIFDAEGNLRRGQIRIFSTSRRIIKKITSRLLKLGYSYSIQITKDNRTTRYKDLYTITVSKAGSFWFECKPLLARKYPSQYPYRTCGKKLTVRNFIPLREEDVYNIETEANSYIANGVIVHNSWVGTSMYSAKKMALGSDATQMLFGVAKKGISWRYQIRLVK